MTPYPFKSIHINERDVDISDIVSGLAAPASEFEKTSFDFIRDWLTGVQSFSVQTSGSTGTPKVITFTRQQMVASALATRQALDLSQGYTAIICLNTKYIGGIMMLVRSLEIQMRIFAMEPSASIAEKLTGYGGPIDFISVVPLQLQNIVEHLPVQYLAHVKCIITGGAPVGEVLKARLKMIDTPVYATYGMTETLSHIALQRISGPRQHDYFQALPGVTISTDDRDCLIIKTPYLTQPVITNDIIELLSENNFLWRGRWDNIINTGGIKVLPERVESVIGEYFREKALTNRFFIYGLNDERLGKKVALFIEGDRIEIQQHLISALSNTLSKYEIPKEIIYISNFTYTGSGKINREETSKFLF